MDAVSISEARKRLSELVAAAEHGKSFTITSHGRTVARIVPVADKPTTSLPDLSDLRASVHLAGGSMSEAISEARRRERY